MMVCYGADLKTRRDVGGDFPEIAVSMLICVLILREMRVCDKVKRAIIRQCVRNNDILIS